MARPSAAVAYRWRADVRRQNRRMPAIAVPSSVEPCVEEDQIEIAKHCLGTFCIAGSREPFRVQENRGARNPGRCVRGMELIPRRFRAFRIPGEGFAVSNFSER